MKRSITIFVFILYLFFFSGTIGLQDEDPNVVVSQNITTDVGIIEIQGIINSINQARKTPLKVSPFLTQSATIRACDMFEKQLWSHDGYTNYLWGAGYSGTDVGENLARHFNDDEVVYRAWLASPAHNEVMTYEKFRYIGIGHCGDYVVAHFGTTIR